ncbi:unnamed protein product, partial [Brenthis ino]
MTTNTGIYHWKLGDIALARICKKVYAKVQVVKNEKGLFHDEKVLGISADETGLIITTQLCYYVEIIRTKQRLWLPYTCMHLASRSRPFYGPAIKEAITKPTVKSGPRKRKIIEDHILPLNVKPLRHKVPDLNISYEIRQMPLRQSKYENAFKEFVRLGKEQLFDHFYEIFCLEDNGDIIDYLQNVNASTEDKFEMVIKNVVTEKEIDNYLHQCWRYNYVHKQVDTKDNSEYSKSSSSNKQPITVHISWCLVCGEAEKLRECTNCPSSFHLACRREWLVSIIREYFLSSHCFWVR